jgi:hypothetical protein
MNENEELIECSLCGQLRTDVKLTEDPYAVEIYGDYQLCWLCSKCYEELKNDI